MEGRLLVLEIRDSPVFNLIHSPTVGQRIRLVSCVCFAEYADSILADCSRMSIYHSPLTARR